MIDPQLWLELATFAKTGTLRKTAEELHLTQPTVTRGMQKLDELLATPLFDRTGNRIKLNDTGKLAADYADKLLKEEARAVSAIRNFGSQTGNFLLASVAPGPLLLAKSLANPSDIHFQDQLLAEEQITETLTDYQATVAIGTREIQTDQLESIYLGKEWLFVNLDKFMPLAVRKSVSFKELANTSFLVLQDIGPWKQLAEGCIPNAHFLYQDDLSALNELSRYSNFPTFSSNITDSLKIHDRDDQRLTIPIVDPKNQIDFYAIYLKENRSRVRPFIRKMIDSWSKLDKTK